MMYRTISTVRHRILQNWEKERTVEWINIPSSCFPYKDRKVFFPFSNPNPSFFVLPLTLAEYLATLNNDMSSFTQETHLLY